MLALVCHHFNLHSVSFALPLVSCILSRAHICAVRILRLGPLHPVVRDCYNQVGTSRSSSILNYANSFTTDFGAAEVVVDTLVPPLAKACGYGRMLFRVPCLSRRLFSLKAGG